MAQITGFHHVAIHAADFDRSIRFYQDVLGLQEKISWGEAPTRAIMLHAGDHRHIEIFEKPDVQPSENGIILHFAFGTDDCVGMLEKVRAAGMKITMEPKVVDILSPGGPVPVHIAFFQGPDGEIIELFESEQLVSKVSGQTVVPT